MLMLICQLLMAVKAVVPSPGSRPNFSTASCTRARVVYFRVVIKLSPAIKGASVGNGEATFSGTTHLVTLSKLRICLPRMGSVRQPTRASSQNLCLWKQS